MVETVLVRLSVLILQGKHGFLEMLSEVFFGQIVGRFVPARLSVNHVCDSRVLNESELLTASRFAVFEDC